MFKFITADADTLTQKRKQSQRACDNCRKKKKRCNHEAVPTGSVEGTHQRDQVSRHQNARRAYQNVADTGAADPRYLGTTAQSVDEHGSRPTEENSEDVVAAGSRFIGDLNPEGVLLAATSLGTIRDASSSIGIWLAQKLGKQSAREAFDAPSALTPFHGFSPLVNNVLLPLLKEESLSRLPPLSDLDALVSFYFDNVHVLFPVINRNRFESFDDDEPARIMLQQAICLVASTNSSVTQNLRFSNEGSCLTPREFRKALFSAMQTSLHLGLITDKMIIIQACALMSFFLDEEDGDDLSSVMCSRAVHCLHSLGLHHDGQSNQDNHYLATLLCCVWALDRLNAAFHGRPVLMHDRDLGRDLGSCIDQQKQCFRLMLRVIKVLDNVIAIYRPKLESDASSWEVDMPPYEDLITDCGALSAPTVFLATIEILYHSVAILSCRSQSTEALSRSSASYLRQRISAERVTLMVRSEYRNQLIVLPFIPYAVSLSASIAYREMRHNKVPMHRTRARNEFQIACGILEQMGNYFSSARIMAEMGKSVLQELERVHSSVHSERRRSRQQGYPQQTNPGRGAGDKVGTALETMDELGVNHAEPDVAGETADGNPPPQQGHSSSIFDDVLGLDAFEMFNSNFDLDGLDAFLESNLDLSFPTYLQ